MNYFSGLEITFCGHLPHHSLPVRERWRNWAINYAHSGVMSYRYENGERQESRAPLAWWVIPGKRYEFEATSGTWDHHYAVFEGRRIQQWLRGGLFPQDRFPFIPIVDANPFKKKWDDLLELCRRTPGATSPRATLLLEDLLLQMREESQRPQTLIPAQIHVRRVISKMQSDPLNADRWSKAHEECGVSLAHFRKLFKQEAALSPGRYALKIRLHEAAQMLVTTRLPVGAVANQSGFEDIYHFSRIFKKYHGTSPRDFRQLHKISNE